MGVAASRKKQQMCSGGQKAQANTYSQKLFRNEHSYPGLPKLKMMTADKGDGKQNDNKIEKQY